LGSLSERIIVQAIPGIKVRPYLKNKAQRARGVAQGVEYLSSKPGTQEFEGKKKKKKKARGGWRRAGN
jgi:hypothetical protein